MKQTLLFIAISFYSLFTFAQTPATALNFDGVNDYVNLTNQTQAFNYNSSSTFTIEFWIKPGDVLTSQTIIGKGSRTAGKGYIIRVVNNQISFRNKNVIIGGVNTAISPTSWSHVAVTYNATAVKIYINGVLKQTGTISINPHNAATPHKMFIGARRADNGNSTTRQRHFKGTIDELRFWNLEKTVSDIMNTKDCALLGTETNLVSYFKFDQGFNNQNNSTQTTLINTTNTAYNGTLNSFALNGVTSNFVTASNVLSSCTLSLNSFDVEQKFGLYPNPTKGQVTVTGLENKSLKNLLVIDVNGRVIKRFDLTNNQKKTFDVSQLNSGLYFVTINSITKTQTIKLLIE